MAKGPTGHPLAKARSLEDRQGRKREEAGGSKGW